MGSQKPTIAFNPAECGFATMHDAEAQRAASGLQTIARSRSAPAATLRSYASNYAAGLLHQARFCGWYLTHAALHTLGQAFVPVLCDVTSEFCPLEVGAPTNLLSQWCLLGFWGDIHAGRRLE